MRPVCSDSTSSLVRILRRSLGGDLLSGLSQQTPHRQIGDLPDGLFIVDDDGLAVVILLVVVGEVLIDFGAGPTVESVAPTSAG